MANDYFTLRIDPRQPYAGPRTPEEARRRKEALRLIEEVPSEVRDMAYCVRQYDNRDGDHHPGEGTVVLDGKRFKWGRKLTGTLEFDPQQAAGLKEMNMKRNPMLWGKEQSYAYKQEHGAEIFTRMASKTDSYGTHTTSWRVSEDSGVYTVEVFHGDLLENDTKLAKAAPSAPPPVVVPTTADEKRLLAEQLLAEAAQQDKKVTGKIEMSAGGLQIAGINVPRKTP